MLCCVHVQAAVRGLMSREHQMLTWHTIAGDLEAKQRALAEMDKTKVILCASACTRLLSGRPVRDMEGCLGTLFCMITGVTGLMCPTMIVASPSPFLLAVHCRSRRWMTCGVTSLVWSCPWVQPRQSMTRSRQPTSARQRASLLNGVQSTPKCWRTSQPHRCDNQAVSL